MGYSREAFKGVSWVGALRFSTRILSIGRIAILARLLTPSQFGLFGIATLVLAFVEMLTETGINIFLVQEKDKVDKYINTAWVVSILRGIVITTVIIAAAWPVAMFFQSPDAFQLLLLISIVPFIRGFFNPSIVQFQKNLRFDQEFWFRFVIFCIDSLVAIAVALLAKTASSVIFGFIAGALSEVLLSFIFLKPRPVFVFKLENFKKVIHRGKWMTAASVFEYLFQHTDDIVVGKLLGASALGLYQTGYRISTLPISEVTDVVNKVMFPVYVKIADDGFRLRRAFLKTTVVVAALTIPFGLVLFFFPEQLIRLILGEQWLTLVPVVKVLAVFGVVRAISNSASSVFIALKRQDLVALLSFISFVTLAIIIVPSVMYFGLVGAGVSALLASFIVIIGILVYLFRIFL